jgi:spore coat polysaccharide biosynthesis protein SpsF
MKVVAIIQSRMGSTRLPGKVMMDLSGKPVLVRCVNRVKRAHTLDEVVVATTNKPADDAIMHLSDNQGWPCFRGSEEDVLDRYYHAAKTYEADVVVRITSDCPLIEPEIVDKVVKEFLERQPGVDYCCNVLPKRTYPRGLDTEVMHFNVLERIWREDQNPAWREHVTAYIHRNPELFRIHGVINNIDCSHMRWTVDESEDLSFFRRIYNHFGSDRFSWQEVLVLLEKHMEWSMINSHIQQKVI